jgi:uncharacterized protein (UPF0332 family)
MSVSWKTLLASRTVQPHKTSKKEIESLRQLVARDLTDAAIEGLSADRCFATAYNAVMQLSKMAIACAGYRVTLGAGHHQKSFDVVKVPMGNPVESLADYFEMCRRKRNHIDYDASEVVTETEAEELLKKAEEFQQMIEEWITKHHPAFRA